ncbi:MAG TPA: HAD hydrolase family protein [Solirubrobacterales bacterium]
MLEVEIPGRGPLRLAHLVLDVNGTIALDGVLLPGVADRLRDLGGSLAIHLLTADTHGRQAELDRALGLQATRLTTERSQVEQKAEHIRRLGADQVVAIGNGANDARMLREAALGIAVVGAEGAAVAALREADVVVTDVLAALDLLRNPRRLVATLRE